MDSENVILDSSVWLAFFIETDTCNARSKKVFTDIQDQNARIFVPEDIIKEIVTVCKNKKQPNLAANFIQRVNDTDNIELLTDNTLFQKTLGVFDDYLHTKLSFVDISLVILSKNYRVITFDKALEKVIND